MSFINELKDITYQLGTKTLPVASAVALATTGLAFVESSQQLGLGTSIFSRRDELDIKLVNLERKLSILQGDVYSEGQPVSPMDSSRVVAIEEKQAALETALGNDIQKAVSVAMMRRDIDEIRNANNKRLDSLESRIESIFQLLLWISGSLITVLLAALGWFATRGSTRPKDQ